MPKPAGALPSIGIRDARPEDADAACAVLRRSISELCAPDHGDDPGRLAAWLANKTIANVRAWIARPAGSFLVAVEGDAILAVGAVTDDGEITLNYVCPDARFRGVSRALLRALEARAAERGATRLTLTTTVTALRFYRTAGYGEESEAGRRSLLDLSCQMGKPIAWIGGAERVTG